MPALMPAPTSALIPAPCTLRPQCLPHVDQLNEPLEVLCNTHTLKAPPTLHAPCLMLTNQLEEPFGILPLETLCDTVQRNVFEILDARAQVKVRAWDV